MSGTTKRLTLTPCKVNRVIEVKCVSCSVCTCVQHPEHKLSGCCAPGPRSCSPAAVWVWLLPFLSAAPPSAGSPAPTGTPLFPAPAVKPPAEPGLVPWTEIQLPGWLHGALLPAAPPDDGKCPDCAPDVPALLWESGWWALTCQSGKRESLNDECSVLFHIFFFILDTDETLVC